MTKPIISEPEYEVRHRLPVQMRFSDTDMLGHVNNSVYLQFLDLAKVNYFTTVNKSEPDWREINMVVAGINIDFLSQTRFGEPLEVLTQTFSIGTKSLRLNQRVVNSATGEVKCAASTTMVCINLRAGATEPIPGEWISLINEFEQRNVK